MAKLLSTWRTATVRDVVLRHFSGPSPTCEERTVRSAEEWGLLKTTAVSWEGWKPDAHKVPPRKYWGNHSIEVHAGDVLVTKAGPRHRVGVVVFVRVTQPQLMVSGKMVGLRPDPSVILPQLLSGILSTRGPQQHLERVKTGMAESQLNFSNSMLLATPLVFPPDLSEQRHIAVILDTVDEAIRQTEAMVEKLKKIKQGLLHDLLTRGIGKDGKLRPTPKQAPHLYKDSPLGKIPNEWEVVNMASCSETFAGGTPSRERLDYYGGSIPWVKSAEVNLDEILSTEESLTAKGLRFSSARWIEPNITLIAMYGATAGQVSWLKIRATANQAVLALPLRDSQTNPRWFYWAAKGAMPRIMASVQGSGQPNLSKGVIDMSLISRPLPSEQKAVRDCLDQIADRINTECCVACKFGLIKQGLIEDLLTGRVPVTGLPKDIEKMLD